MFCSKPLQTKGEVGVLAVLSKDSMSEERQKFESLLADKAARNKLLQSLVNIEERQACVLPLRFCIAVNEYFSLSGVEQKQKARKIVGVFIQPGSMFQLQDIPEEFQAQLISEKFSNMPKIREYYVQKLSIDRDIQLTMKELNLL